MSGTKDNFAFDWIKSDLLQSIDNARVGLDQYAESSDEMHLRSCLTALHQVHGTLVMLDLDGVTGLADHLEQLCQGLFDQNIDERQKDQGAQLLMQGILELPGYLEEIQRGGQQQNQLAVPLTNDVRTLLGMSPLADGGINLAAAVSEDALSRFKQIDGPSKVMRIRSALQNVLLKVLKGEDRSGVVELISKIALGMQKLNEGTALERQWEALGEFAQSLSLGTGPIPNESVVLLRRVDAELKSMIAAGDDGLEQAVNVELVKDLVEACQAENHTNPTIQALQDAVDSGDRTNSLAIFGRQALSSAAAALKEELASVKDKLDLLVRAPQVDLEMLGELSDPLCQIGDTLSVLGFESSKEIVSDQVDAVENLVVLGDTDPQNVQSIAGALIQIDENLSSVAQGGSQTEVELITSQAEIALLEEARLGIEQIKQKVVDFVAAHWDVRHLEGADQILEEVIGALSMVSLPKATALLSQANDYICDKLMQGHQPSWQELDLFADGVSGVDYYLERLAQDGGKGNEDVIAAAQRSFVDLGELLLASNPESNSESVQSSIDEAVPAEPTQEQDLASEQEPEQEPGLKESLEVQSHGTDSDDASTTPDLSQDIEFTPVSLDIGGTQPVSEIASSETETIDAAEIAEVNEADETTNAIEFEAPELEAHESSESAVDQTEAPSESLREQHQLDQPEEYLTEESEEARVAAPSHPSVDQEIAEIFVEECAEVVENIDLWLPQWQNLIDTDDTNPGEALTELRRAFHTLKGSGRIVHAAAIGEIAWAVENMLNRLIDGTVQGNKQFVQVTQSARNLLPQLIEDFELQRPGDMDQLSALIDQADVLSSGGAIDEVLTGDVEEPAEVVLEESPVLGLDEQAPDEMLAQTAVNETLEAQTLAAEEEAGDASHEETSLEETSLEETSQEEAAPQETDSEEQPIFELEAHAEQAADDQWLQESVSSPFGGKSSAMDLFIEEALEQLAVIRAECEVSPWRLSEPLVRAYHTMAGSAAIADISQVCLIVEPTYQVIETYAQREAGAEVEAFVKEATQLLTACFDALQNDTDWDEPLELVAKADDLIALAELSKQPSVSEILLNATGITDLLESDEALIAYVEGRHDNCADLLTALSESEQVLKEIDQPLSAALAGSLARALTTTTIAGQVIQQMQAPLSAGYASLLEGLNNIVAGDQPEHPDVLFTDLEEACLLADEYKPDEEVVQALIQDTVVEEEADPLASEATPATVEALMMISEEQLSLVAVDPLANPVVEQAPQLEEQPQLEEDLGAELEAETALAISAEPLPQVEDFPELDAPVFDQEFQDEIQDEENKQAPQLETAEAAREAAPEVVPDELSVGEEAEETEEAQEPGVLDWSAQTLVPTADATAEGADTIEDYAEIDEDLAEVFFEEAEELSDELENAIVSWQSEPENRLHMETLLRALHTFKGGARLCGLTSLGDQAHNFESLLIEVQSEQKTIDDELFAALNNRYDELALGLQNAALKTTDQTVQQVAQEALPDTLNESDMNQQAEADAAPMDDAVSEQDALKQDDAPLEPADLALSGDEHLAQVSTDAQVTDAAPVTLPDTLASQSLDSTAPVTEAGEPLASTSPLTQEPPPSAAQPVERNNQEMVRVGSNLLEELVNLAGEGSILRARIEQGMSDFTGALDEMETTIERLREQLRRFEIETEAQILYRHEQDSVSSYDEFDPLEMDRYSQLQQLSKGLSESASDMLDLKETLLFKARESETLLLQQARVNTELQEGLMRTRMVPFNRMLPRLRRIVRQVSNELGKEVELSVFNAEGELDRNLLERMVAPLEHMLRNAIDHGIEAPNIRQGFGKPEKGRIDLRLLREGGDVVIEISDDGAGVDVENVRAKALDQGLIAKDANLSDEEVVQFILAPGFSTAKSVTQISGRGVGMDVVHSEVKQLGGSINIQSKPGKGSRFVVRVPFTVSVNRALMVSVADDQYAIPLNNIEGIVLLSPEQLQDLYSSENKSFEYAGIPYRVRYLGQYLGREFTHDNLINQGHSSVPMVLVRSGDHAVAIHVDTVHGSREIVVKSLGPQFAGVGGISGATILGDGSVVVILDLLALIRAAQYQQRPGSQTPQKIAPAGPTCVLVVDDSVTVRKVTSRLLERQGMDVLLAKDGIEAVAMLQERRPDVMLLDIEMPRMDGFEVARQVRHDERLQALPIVMISSRTGEKHKEHADQLGVDRFLGKPFQEHELLATIDELVPRT
ncbi:MAG: Hpt domain-containing protein [Pseudomonadota bacterium]